MKTVRIPVCLFCYNRFDEFQKTVIALLRNYQSKNVMLFVFSDGPKSESDKRKIQKIRGYVKKIEGFKSVTLFESKVNKGLASSIIEGVSSILDKYESVIVLEDDLITSPNFLDFMQQALKFYRNKEQVFSISGYSLDLPSLHGIEHDIYFGYRASSWGWGIWKDRWEKIEWNLDDNFSKLLSAKRFSRFLRGGSDLPLMLWKQKKGIIDSWAVRWCYHQSLNDMVTVFPSKSKIENIGFSEGATHSTTNRRFTTKLDNSNKREFYFPDDVYVDHSLSKEFKNKFSFWNRLMDRFPNR